MRGRKPVEQISRNLVIFVLCTGIVSVAYADSANITVRSVTIDNKPFDGMWVEIRSGPNVLKSGFTPLQYNYTEGATYTVNVSDYEKYKFAGWDDGTTSYSKTITPTNDTVLLARYMEAKPEAIPQPTSLLPDWLKGVASSWLNGKMSDQEFISQLQLLVDQKILSTPQKEGFSNIQCKKGETYVEMVGKYTNGNTPYKIVSLRMMVLDANKEILATGSGTISNIGSSESKYFNVIARHATEFASCEVQVESVLPR